MPPPVLLRTEKARRNFLQEAQTTRKLRHENIVAVHDVNTTPEGILYISMELAAGESLRELLRRQRNEKRLVEVRFAVSVVSQMLAGSNTPTASSSTGTSSPKTSSSSPTSG